MFQVALYAFVHLNFKLQANWLKIIIIMIHFFINALVSSALNRRCKFANEFLCFIPMFQLNTVMKNIDLFIFLIKMFYYKLPQLPH